jgi:hypothetical protein
MKARQVARRESLMPAMLKAHQPIIPDQAHQPIIPDQSA